MGQAKLKNRQGGAGVFQIAITVVIAVILGGLIYGGVSYIMNNKFASGTKNVLENDKRAVVSESSTVSSTVAEKMLGDLSGDGVINLVDVEILQRYIFNGETDVSSTEADVNRDGRVNLYDLITLTQLGESETREPGIGKGDVNGDGILSESDIEALRAYLTNGTPLPYPIAADVNKDGVINSADLAFFAEYYFPDGIKKEDFNLWYM